MQLFRVHSLSTKDEANARDEDPSCGSSYVTEGHMGGFFWVSEIKKWWINIFETLSLKKSQIKPLGGSNNGKRCQNLGIDAFSRWFRNRDRHVETIIIAPAQRYTSSYEPIAGIMQRYVDADRQANKAVVCRRREGKQTVLFWEIQGKLSVRFGWQVDLKKREWARGFRFLGDFSKEMECRWGSPMWIDWGDDIDAPSSGLKYRNWQARHRKRVFKCFSCFLSMFLFLKVWRGNAFIPLDSKPIALEYRMLTLGQTHPPRKELPRQLKRLLCTCSRFVLYIDSQTKLEAANVA